MKFASLTGLMKMYLDRRMERILEGEEGVGKQLALRTLIALGEAYRAERFVEISSAHISGVSYETLGDHGKDLISRLSDARVSVKTTLNPIGFDRDLPSMVDTNFYKEQVEILALFERMGVKTTCTCAPYFNENVPSFGEIIAWAESSAIVYANSMLGARSNRESGFSALCSAILGVTPLHSLHLKENRAPTYKIRVVGDIQAGRLGLYLGKEFSGIPYIVFEKKVDEDYVRNMGAAMAASGNVALFHVEGLTPEYKDFESSNLTTYVIHEKDIEELYEDILDFEAVVLGCPHLSENEILKIHSILRGRKPHVDIYLFTSRSVISRVRNSIDYLRSIGVKVLCDTCMVVSPFLRGKYRVLATNSGKAYNYLRSAKFGGFTVRLLTLEEILNASSR